MRPTPMCVYRRKSDNRSFLAVPNSAILRSATLEYIVDHDGFLSLHVGEDTIYPRDCVYLRPYSDSDFGLTHWHFPSDFHEGTCPSGGKE